MSSVGIHSKEHFNLVSFLVFTISSLYHPENYSGIDINLLDSNVEEF
jgi:hypothetical protein